MRAYDGAIGWCTIEQALQPRSRIARSLGVQAWPSASMTLASASHHCSAFGWIAWNKEKPCERYIARCVRGDVATLHRPALVSLVETLAHVKHSFNPKTLKQLAYERDLSQKSKLPAGQWVILCSTDTRSVVVRRSHWQRCCC